MKFGLTFALVVVSAGRCPLQLDVERVLHDPGHVEVEDPGRRGDVGPGRDALLDVESGSGGLTVEGSGGHGVLVVNSGPAAVFWFGKKINWLEETLGTWCKILFWSLNWLVWIAIH